MLRPFDLLAHGFSWFGKLAPKTEAKKAHMCLSAEIETVTKFQGIDLVSKGKMYNCQGKELLLGRARV